MLVLRRDPVDHDHWHAPTVLPILGAIACAGLIVQKAVEEPKDLLLGAGLIALGVVLWVITRAIAGPAEPIDPARLVD